MQISQFQINSHLVVLSCFLLSGCIASPEISHKKINAIALQQAAPPLQKSADNSNHQKVVDRCSTAKPEDEYFALCQDRERNANTKLESKAVIFEWKKK
ncbi:hypothetical protein [Paraglaciecola aestuariivivens]